MNHKRNLLSHETISGHALSVHNFRLFLSAVARVGDRNGLALVEYQTTSKTMKIKNLILDLLIVTIVAIVFFACQAYAQNPLPPLSECDYGKLPGKVDAAVQPSYYEAGRLFLGGAGTFRLKDVADTQNITGAGGFAIQGGYHVVDNVAIVGEAATENTGHSVFDSVAGGLQAWIPIADTGLAPYGKVIGGKQFEADENWFVAGEGGLELRGKLAGIFAGVRYQYDLEERSDVMLVIGVNGHFGTK